MKKKLSSRSVAAQLGVTDRYVRRLLRDHLNPDSQTYVEGLTVFVERRDPPINQHGHLLLTNKDGVEALKKWLDAKSEGHKYRRISKI